MNIYLDGSGWNGRVCKYAVVFEDGRKIIECFAEKKTNNEMEYAALIRAAKVAQTGDALFTDSQLLERQIKGWYKVRKAHLRPLMEKAKELLTGKSLTLTWIPREKNKAGHVLESMKGFVEKKVHSVKKNLKPKFDIAKRSGY